MVFVRRYFMEITALDDYKDEDLAFALSNVLPHANVKLHRSSIIEVRHK